MRNNNVKNLKIDHLISIEPQTQKQEIAHSEWKKNNSHLVLNGSAGTGKTYTALYLALDLVMNKSNPQNKIHLIRSVVPTREVGFLPGTIEEKLLPYTAPYRAICAELFECPNAYDILTDKGIIEFHSTSFIRGMTFDNSVIVVDEMQNCTGRELNTIITRIGENTRFMLCGDYYQSDFTRNGDKKDILSFLEILETCNGVSKIDFTWSDILRSDFVRDYIISKDIYCKNNTLDW